MADALERHGFEPMSEREKGEFGEQTERFVSGGCVREDGLKLREGDQQLPVVNDEQDIQSRVIADIRERREVGIGRYGTALQPHNGRDALRDLYEELLDGRRVPRILR
jgi:hypothetical protein